MTGTTATGARTRRRRTTALPPGAARRVNHGVERLAALGLTPGNTVSLEVVGRRSGRPRRTAVVVARHDGHRYVVSLAGEADWVRNLRAAGGRAVVRHGRAAGAQLVEVPAAGRAPILRAFLDRRALTRSPARSARIYFGLPPHPSLAQLAPLADRYPVFEIRTDRGADQDAAPGPVRSVTRRAAAAVRRIGCDVRELAGRSVRR